MGRRKSNGEGTIYPRKDGRWEGALYVLTTDGTRKRLRVYGRTQAEARAKLDEQRAKQQQGILTPSRAWRLSEFFDYWLAQSVQSKRKPLTYRRAESVVRIYLKPNLGNERLSGLSVHTVQRFIDRLIAKSVSPATIHQVRKVLSAALTYAVRNEFVVRNVARLVELPSYKPEEADYWTPDEAQQFLDAASSDPLYPLFALLLMYGLRSGEVRGIRWCDVDFQRDILHVKQQVQRINGSMQEVPLKTSASRRDEPLLATAKDLLELQRSKQTAARHAAGSAWQGAGDDTELVFTTRSGNPIEARNVYRSFQRICSQNNVRAIKLHGLRHTNATTQKDMQVHDRDIQAVLGHGDVRTTGIYQHVDMASKQAALTKVERRLFALRADDGSSSRQKQPSSQRNTAIVAGSDDTKENTPPLSEWGICFGGSSQTRTGDTRLFRKTEYTMQHRIASVRQAMRARTCMHIVGIAAVALAVEVERSKDAQQPNQSSPAARIGQAVLSCHP